MYAHMRNCGVLHCLNSKHFEDLTKNPKNKHTHLSPTTRVIIPLCTHSHSNNIALSAHI